MQIIAPDVLKKVEEVEHGKPAFALPRTGPSDVLEGIVRRIGETTSWIWALLVAAIVVNVTLRYVFGRGYIAFEEIQWHLYGAGFVLGLSYCLTADRHVRIDVLAERWPVRWRLWIELVGLLIFLMPFVVYVFMEAVPFVVRSYELHEVSVAPGGLPYRWAIKSFMLIGFALLFVAGLGRLIRVSAALFGWPTPRA